ncbi:unnamed protein product [Urochloa humidicola]
MATSSLLLDLILDIAARSNPATLVRCAAACKELRRHIADPAFRHRLRLRRSDNCFVPSLLRGHLVVRHFGVNDELHLVDTTSPYVTRDCSAPPCTSRRVPTASSWRHATASSSSARPACYTSAVKPPAIARPSELILNQIPMAVTFCSSAMTARAAAPPLAGRSKCPRRAWC